MPGPGDPGRTLAGTDPGRVRSVLVVAHPDDEVLWFSSLLGEVDKVFIVFKDSPDERELGRRRTRALAELPFEVVCLEVPEAGTFALADWEHPQTSPFGMVLNRTASGGNIAALYEMNFYSIRARLRDHLSPGLDVFTHNPWGEYGHEDHVQVFRVMDSLRIEIGYTLRVSSYISKRSGPMARSYAPGAFEPVRREIDPCQSNRIADIYKKQRCWTWVDNWEWDTEEHFLACPVPVTPGSPGGSIDDSRALRWVPSPV